MPSHDEDLQCSSTDAHISDAAMANEVNRHVEGDADGLDITSGLWLDHPQVRPAYQYLDVFFCFSVFPNKKLEQSWATWEVSIFMHWCWHLSLVLHKNVVVVCPSFPWEYAFETMSTRLPFFSLRICARGCAIRVGGVMWWYLSLHPLTFVIYHHCSSRQR